MKKAFVLFLIIVLFGFVLGSCGVKQVVTYCPFCSEANIKEISTYDPSTGHTDLYYQCQNSECGKTFGAGRL
jgi:transposase-like protein